MDVALFAFVAAAIYLCAGIAFRKEFLPPSKRSLYGRYWGRFIVPDRFTMPFSGFDALEDPRIWYPVSKRSAVGLIALSLIYFVIGLASKLFPDDWVNEDRIFLLFLVTLVLGQFLIWMYSYRTAKTFVRRLGLDSQ